jgi:hypothetical protein
MNGTLKLWQSNLLWSGCSVILTDSFKNRIAAMENHIDPTGIIFTALF